MASTLPRKFLGLAIYFIVFAIYLAWEMRTTHASIESYRFIDIVESEASLAKIRRDNVPFDLLFANALTAPTHFTGKLYNFFPLSKKSLWIFASQADNHANLSVSIGQQLIGKFEARITESLTTPRTGLHFVADLPNLPRNATLSFTLEAQSLPHYYSELGLLVIAPRGMTEQAILSTLNGRADSTAHDIYIPLFFLALASVVFADMRKQPSHWSPFALALAVSIIFGSFSAHFWLVYRNNSSPLLSESRPRTLFERGVEDAFRGAMQAIDHLQRTIICREAPPHSTPACEDRVDSLTTSIYFTESKIPEKLVSAALLWGLVDHLSAMPPRTFNAFFLLLLAGAAAAILINQYRPKCAPVSVALCIVVLLSLFASIRLSEGFDEFFINLRHSYMLANHGVFSINANSMFEATVDFLPLLLATFVSFVGTSLPDSLLIICLAGNAMVVVATYLIVFAFVGNRAWALLSASAIALFPNVLFVGGTGFGAVLFSGWILLSLYHLLFGTRPIFGLVLTATLTLVRTEGILFAGLIFLYIIVFRRDIIPSRPKTPRALAIHSVSLGLLLASPFFLSCIIRFLSFGHALPTPISFKNTGLNSDYISAGIGRFSEMVCSHDVHFLAIVLALLFLARCFRGQSRAACPPGAPAVTDLAGVCVILFIYTCPYFIGGGDWFPAHMNRYGLPFVLFLLISLFVMLWHFVTGFSPSRIAPHLAVMYLAILVGAHVSSCWYRIDSCWYETWLALQEDRTNRWGRIDRLASLGAFLDRNLPGNAIVASPEEATIMYYSRREMVGLLGVSNPIIAAMPLQPMQVGDILHRKRAISALHQSAPDVVAMYEPVSFELLPRQTELVNTVSQLTQVRFFNQYMASVAHYRVGGFSELAALGYTHFTVAHPNGLFSIFIHERIRTQFVNALVSDRYSHIGNGTINYSVDGLVMAKFPLLNP